MSLGIGALIICAIIGIAVVIDSRFISTDWQGNHDSWSEALRSGGIVAAFGAAAVLAVWFIVAVPISTYNRNVCKREADGYQLGYDWSLRNGCRIELPSGQLVPSSKIRITSDGEIVVGAE